MRAPNGIDVVLPPDQPSEKAINAYMANRGVQDTAAARRRATHELAKAEQARMAYLTHPDRKKKTDRR